jgi:hypothetical protein
VTASVYHTKEMCVRMKGWGGGATMLKGPRENSTSGMELVHVKINFCTVIQQGEV